MRDRRDAEPRARDQLGAAARASRRGAVGRDRPGSCPAARVKCPSPCALTLLERAPGRRTPPASAPRCPSSAPRRPTRCASCASFSSSVISASSASTRSATGRDVSAQGVLHRGHDEVRRVIRPGLCSVTLRAAPGRGGRGGRRERRAGGHRVGRGRPCPAGRRSGGGGGPLRRVRARASRSRPTAPTTAAGDQLRRTSTCCSRPPAGSGRRESDLGGVDAVPPTLDPAGRGRADAARVRFREPANPGSSRVEYHRGRSPTTRSPRCALADEAGTRLRLYWQPPEDLPDAQRPGDSSWSGRGWRRCTSSRGGRGRAPATRGARGPVAGGARLAGFGGGPRRAAGVRAGRPAQPAWWLSEARTMGELSCGRVVPRLRSRHVPGGA